MTQQAIAIKNDYEGQPGRDNYSTLVEFDIEEGAVRIYEFFGNGQSMRSYHGLFLGHNRSAQFANVDEIVSLLEGDDAQELMQSITGGFESVWDGSNHVGRLTESASEDLETLQNLVEECWGSLPTYWEADEWFGPAGITGQKVLDLIEGHGDIEDAVAAEVSSARPESFLQESDVEQYFRHQLGQLAETDDAEEVEVANRARKLLDLKPFTTLQAQFDEYDQRPSGVKFTENTLKNGTEVTLVNDGNGCWLANTEDLQAAMEEVIEDGRAGQDEAEDSCWWYEQLCRKVTHQQNLVPAFEAEFGQRNWP